MYNNKCWTEFGTQRKAVFRVSLHHFGRARQTFAVLSPLFYNHYRSNERNQLKNNNNALSLKQNL